MGPLISADLGVVAGLNRELLTHVIELDTGAEFALEPCEVVRAIDHSGRLTLIDGQTLCTDELDQKELSEPAVSSRVLDVVTGRTVLDLGARTMWSGVFGPAADDGLPGLVARLGNANEVEVYRLPAGDLLGTYVSDEGFPLAAAFTADGRRLAVTKQTGQLVVIDLGRLEVDPTDAVVWTAAAHTGSVIHVATSATGLIATGSFSGNVRVWSSDGTMIADLPVQPEGGPALAFADGTDTLYYEDAGGVIRRFTPDTDQLTELALSMLTREFTPDECARYFPDGACPTFLE